jgi:hypothetical protein
LRQNNRSKFSACLRFSRDLHPSRPASDDHPLATPPALLPSMSRFLQCPSSMLTALLDVLSLCSSTFASTSTPWTGPTGTPTNPSLIPAAPTFNSNYLGIITITPYQPHYQRLYPTPCNPGELKLGDFQLYIHAPGIDDLHGKPIISNVHFRPLHLIP